MINNEKCVRLSLQPEFKTTHMQVICINEDWDFIDVLEPEDKAPIVGDRATAQSMMYCPCGCRRIVFQLKEFPAWYWAVDHFHSPEPLPAMPWSGIVYFDPELARMRNAYGIRDHGPVFDSSPGVLGGRGLGKTAASEEWIRSQGRRLRFPVITVGLEQKPFISIDRYIKRLDLLREYMNFRIDHGSDPFPDGEFHKDRRTFMLWIGCNFQGYVNFHEDSETL